MIFAPGPIFANIVLADEINRTPPKTQSALLEAMQEHRVTIQGRTYELEEPFFVFATQNPIELEGTYPLPEAQLDRFMFHIVIEHPPEDEEYEVVRTTTAILEPRFERPISGADLVAIEVTPLGDDEDAIVALGDDVLGRAQPDDPRPEQPGTDLPAVQGQPRDRLPGDRQVQCLGIVRRHGRHLGTGVDPERRGPPEAVTVLEREFQFGP